MWNTWLGEPFSDRWARTILAEEEVRKYNRGDVIMVQEEKSRGYVYLILTGYCDVVVYNNDEFQTIASLQAGEIIGEMAVVTGTHKRNASVVASSPVTVMVFPEESFNEFVVKGGYRDKLMKRWNMRTALRRLPQFRELISTVLEKVSAIADEVLIPAGQTFEVDDASWYLFYEGSAKIGDQALSKGDELGYRPFSSVIAGTVTAETDTRLVKFPKEEFSHLLFGTPQLNYMLRKHRVESNDPEVDWFLGEVSTY
jgi:CRP-like cAMP-binding protein